MVKGRKPISDESEEEDKRPAESDSEGEAADETEEEYEIEDILEAKHGAFPGGEMGYYVKWKNYDKSHNSWVTATDAGNAQALIDEFWRNQPKNTKGGRKSDVKGTASAVKKRMPVPKESDEESAPAPKKRGRPPKAKSPSDDEMDVEEIPPPKKPRAEKKGANGTASAKAKPKTKAALSPEPIDEDAEEDAYQDMSKYKNAESWEHLVDHIDTVERQDDGTLFVYFRLKSKREVKPLCREPSSACKDKMPQLLLEFYEQNLRWRAVDEEGEKKD